MKARNLPKHQPLSVGRIRMTFLAMAVAAAMTGGAVPSLHAADSPGQAEPRDNDVPGASVPSEPVPGVNPNETLSEQLDRNKGVIEPPPVGDDDIHVTVPNPNSGTMPVIPPPGTPGGNPDVEPK
jgi:hypothetical protein